jgi:acetolactate synthase-1/3 small subunit
MRHIISMLVENESGALSRIAGLFSARGYNIESLTVAPTDEPSLSRMTLVTRGNDDIVEQIKKQLNKLIDVVKLQDLSEGEHIEREMMLIKLKAARTDREELKRLTEIFRAKIIDVTESSYVVELTGASRKLDAFIEAVPEGLITEVVRSGPTGISRGAKGLTL